MDILLTDTVTDEMEAVIGDGLNDYNSHVAGYADSRPVAVVVRAPDTGRILGGATGRTSFGLLFLDLFYLPLNLRKQGLGTRILHAFEEEGRRRGCTSAVLYTISFQAPAFYERNGWRRFGEVPCHPEGTSRIFLSKTL